MEFSLMDFLIGLFLMNAMPHFVIGVANIRFLSLFGFSGTANMCYSALCFAVSLALFHIEYGISDLLQNGIFLGAMTILVIYYFTTKFLYKFFELEL